MRHFPLRRFQIWGEFSYRTISLAFLQNNPQHKVDEISDSQARNQIELNSKEANTLIEKILQFLSFPLIVYNFPPLLSFV